ncbi:MAG: hypothetical protein ACQERU_12740 [Bacteroidota bacterium]
MKWHEKVRIVLYIWWLDVKSLPGKIKRRIWNKHILLWWHRLYIRKDEFHRSLDMDGATMLEMNEQERKKYLADLVRRREIAHQRDLTKC